MLLTNKKKHSINNMEFTLSKGIVDVLADGKSNKHLCISAATTRLPLNMRLKEHEYEFFVFS
jgi:hypothetical protein